MKQNEEETQYYYDSSADQWWCYDEQQQCWVPWKEEEETVDTVEASPATAADVGATASANGAPPAAAIALPATGACIPELTATTNAADVTPLCLSVKAEDTAENGGNGVATVFTGDDAKGAGTLVECGGAKAGASIVEAVAPDPRSAEKEQPPAIKGNFEREAADEPSRKHGSTQVHRVQAEIEKAAVGGAGRAAHPPLPQPKTDVSEGERTDSTQKRLTRGAGAAAATAEGETSKEKKQQNEDTQEDAEGGKQEEEIHDPELDRVRSALESLATSPYLDRALMHIGSSPGLDTQSSRSIAVGGSQVELLEEKKDEAAAAGSDSTGAPPLRREDSGWSIGRGELGMPAMIEGIDEEGDEGQENDTLGELRSNLKHDPIVRRSTRMLTFKDKGGLAGCLQEAAKQRNVMIKEAGGYIPGTEQYREEAWKQRARELASQTHARMRSRWRDAAKKASDASGEKGGGGEGEGQDKVMHFSDLVEQVRRKSETDNHQIAQTQASLSRKATRSLGSMSTLPPKARHSAHADLVAASLLLKPGVALREQRRRSSGFPGGQQGHVRFADAAFRDPNSQLQMQDLLTQQSRRKATYGEEDLALSIAETSAQHQRQEGGREG